MFEKLKERTIAIRSELLMLFFLFCIALGVRLFLLFKFPHVLFLKEADAVAFFSIAKSILSTFSLSDTATHYTPFYPLVIAIFTLPLGYLELTGSTTGAALAFNVPFGSMELVGRLVSCTMGAALVFPVYLIGKELYGKRVGYLSAFLTILFEPFLDYSLQPITQTTYLFLVALSAYLGIIMVRSRSPIIFFLTGISCGAIYLTRPEGVIFFGGLSTVILFDFILNGDTNLKKKITLFFLFVLAFVLLALPYMIYLHDHFGRWVLTGKGSWSMIGMDAGSKLLAGGKMYGDVEFAKQLGIFHYFDSFQDMLIKYFSNLSAYMKIILTYFPYICLFFVFIGILHILRTIIREGSESRRTNLLQNSILFGLAISALPVFLFNIGHGAGYILPILLLMIIYFSVGLIAVENGITIVGGLLSFGKLEKIKKWSLVSIIAVTIFSYFSVAPLWGTLNSPYFKFRSLQQKFFLKNTGDWLRQKTPKDAVFMSRWSAIDHYAERKHVYMPDGGIMETINYAKKHGAQYIVIDSAAVPNRRPKLMPLLNSKVRHSGLRLVYAKEKFRIKVLIYKIL